MCLDSQVTSVPLAVTQGVLVAPRPGLSDRVLVRPQGERHWHPCSPVPPTACSARLSPAHHWALAVVPGETSGPEKPIVASHLLGRVFILPVRAWDISTTRRPSSPCHNQPHAGPQPFLLPPFGGVSLSAILAFLPNLVTFPPSNLVVRKRDWCFGERKHGIRRGHWVPTQPSWVHSTWRVLTDQAETTLVSSAGGNSDSTPVNTHSPCLPR